MVPRVPPEYEDLRRQQILDAAWHLFGEKGYHQTTLRDLAAHMQLSTGVIYTYFTAKDEILEALQERSRQENAAFIARLAGEGSLREFVARLFAEYSRCWQEPDGRRAARASSGLLIDTMRQGETRAKAVVHYEHFARTIVRLCRDAQRRGELVTDIDPEAYGSFLIALFLGLQIQSGLLDRPGVAEGLGGIKRILLENVWSPGAEPAPDPPPAPGDKAQKGRRKPGDEA